MNSVSRLGMDIIRFVFFFIDLAVYGLVTILYNVMAQLAKMSFLDQAGMDSLAERIYVFLGVFVLFKILFSLINSFVNPDSWNDKKEGGPQILKRLIVALTLLAIVPLIFTQAFRLQHAVLNENIIGSVFMGASSNPDEFDTAGNLISVTIFQGFFQPAKTASGSLVCPDVERHSEITTVGMARQYLNTHDSNEYCYNYSFFISTIAGGFAAWIMLLFAIDIALRSAKLTFLQLLAPFPILSYVDPKNEKVFHSWVKETLSTYADLFVRLLSLFLMVFFIIELTKSGVFSFYEYDSDGVLSTSTSEAGVFVRAIAIIGLLMFAKQAPDLLYNILGLQKPKGFTLNPMTKLAQVPGVGKLSALGLGAAGGAAAGALAGRASGQSLAGAMHGAVTGGRSGAANVPMSGSDGKSPKAISSGFQGAYKNFTGKEYSIMSSEGLHSSFRPEVVTNKTEEHKNKIGEYEEKQQDLDMQMDQIKKAYSRAAEQGDQEEMNRTRELFTANRKNHGQYDKMINLRKDYIKDIEEFWKYDKSNVSEMAPENLANLESAANNNFNEVSMEIGDTQATQPGGTQTQPGGANNNQTGGNPSTDQYGNPLRRDDN